MSRYGFLAATRLISPPIENQLPDLRDQPFTMAAGSEAQLSTNIGHGPQANDGPSRQVRGRDFAGASPRVALAVRAELCLDEAVELPVHSAQGASNVGVIRFAQAREHDAVKAKLTMVDGLIPQKPLCPAPPFPIATKHLGPRLLRELVHVLDGRDEHGFLVRPEAVKNVLANAAPSCQLCRGCPPVAQLAKRSSHHR